MRIEYGEMVIEVNRKEYLVMRDALMVLSQSLEKVSHGESCNQEVKEILEEVLVGDNWEQTYSQVNRMLDDMRLTHRRRHG